MLRNDVERLGYQVVGTTGSGGEAIVRAEALQPDLALMDIHLADGADGIQVAAKIQASPIGAMVTVLRDAAGRPQRVVGVNWSVPGGRR